MPHSLSAINGRPGFDQRYKALVEKPLEYRVLDLFLCFVKDIMPLTDMPLEQLLKYQGRNPRPHDFDAFWDKSVEEMHALDAQVELRPAS
ncbi:MAG TPA: acetylxylan esterase, partial [Abditibacteriaceae bacterium]|nr:acetylxylan esterase [Abditibacteriaceae bacterium]